MTQVYRARVGARRREVLLAGLLVTTLGACTSGAGTEMARPAPRQERTTPRITSPSPTASEAPQEAENRWVTPRPPWLGTRVLPEGPEGFGIAERTPRVLRNRRFATIELFPPPSVDRFSAEVGAVPPGVAKRSTWRPRCPVALEDLAYLKMSFWGFDRRPHTGEMIVHESVAHDIVSVFRALWRARFPIEEMRVATLQEQRRWIHRSTGDTNLTSGLECRRSTLGSSWSEHASGLAIDINPFHNPYLRGDLVAPELARSYADRSWERPGMIHEGDVVTNAFDRIGWGWGGRWSSLKDWMHFSASGH